jgi:hypothetical protein
METLGQIELMLRIYYTGYELSDVYTEMQLAQARDDAAWLANNGYIISGISAEWGATPKGAAFVEAVRGTPEPTQTWTVERNQ